MAFLPTGLVKALGRRFAILPVESPVGFFFEAIGWLSQIAYPGSSPSSSRA